MAKAFADLHHSVFLSIPLFFPPFLTKQISNKAAAAGMQMERGGTVVSKGVKIVRQRDALAGVALWRTAKTHPRGRKREEGDRGYWLTRFAACPADFHFMARELQSPLGVYNPCTHPPGLPSLCLYHIILLVFLDMWLLSAVHNDPSMWGFFPQPDCCTTVSIPICYWMLPFLIRIQLPSLTCCCPMVSCRDASKRPCPPWH